MFWHGVKPESEKHHNDFFYTAEVSQEIETAIYLSLLVENLLVPEKHRLVVGIFDFFDFVVDGYIQIFLEASSDIVKMELLKLRVENLEPIFVGLDRVVS